MTESSTPKKRLIAVCGKGGTGKTASIAMMVQALVENPATGRLLLIDADPAMGLLSALGVSVRRTMGQVREEIIKTARGGKKQAKAQIGEMIDYMAFEALTELDDFAVLAMGRTETLAMPKVPFRPPRLPCLAKIVSNPPSRFFAGKEKRP